jgi:maltooligosyltrehalose trehalohydrolase
VHASYDEVAGWFVLERGRYRVMVNLADGAREVPVGGSVVDVVLTWEPGATSAGTVLLASQSVAVVRVA